ncbi:MAG: hypothetical protein JO317_08405 [Verrucomicrobiae bacterium]|nr:hypothetical protein [Verrucomicrobiae bacterium]
MVLTAAFAFNARAEERYSAFDALQQASRVVPRSAVHNVVRVEGINGHVQPKQWKITYFDESSPRDTRVVTVAKDEVLKIDQPLAILSGADEDEVMNLNDVKLDSTTVVNAVHRLCYDNKLPLYYMDAVLEKPQGGMVTPLWVCHLKNARQNEFGAIKVSAKTGKILETEGVVLSANSKLRAEKSFGASIRDTFLGIGGKIEQWFSGERTVDE